MLKFRITDQDKTEKIIPASEVSEHYASKVCRENGWAERSAAWRDLAVVESCSVSFLKAHASEMFPGATVEFLTDETVVIQGVKFEVIRVDGDPYGDRMPKRILLRRNGVTAEYVLTLAIDASDNIVQKGDDLK